MSQTNVEHTLRDIWATRPRRRSSDRKIAGVAAAIARRYAIDPVLVRVAFVVATISGGAGVLLYLLGWLLLPQEDHTADDHGAGSGTRSGRGRGTMSAVLTVVLVLLMIPAAGAVFSGHGSGVIGLAVAFGALYLLHRSRSALGEIPGAPPAPTRQPDTAPAATTPATTTGDPEESAPPAWDPLGAAPFAWDLPEPSAQPEPTDPPPGARWKITPITLGLALLVGGITLAFAPALSAAQVAALLLGVVGLGLVVGAFLQGGRGLILVAIPLALLTWVLSAAPAAGFKVGTSYWEPTTAAQVQPQYSVTVGNGNLDLSGLRLTDSQTVRTSVAVGVGQTRVYLPPNVNAQVSCKTQIGDVDCLGQRDADGHPSRVTVTDNGPDGPGGGTLILDVHSGIGQVRVDRES
ncbi:MAG TPA: PspC domain-containing protein [Pseudonocardiaceae bacterium]|nr:PspC domain-containing protein [Pseudonocardiaceae bacterium]